jgi:CHAT domain-containing protein
MKAHHRKIMLEVYVDLLRALFDEPGSSRQELIGEALRVADLLRAQGVQRALAANAARGAAQDPALSTLVREEQDLRRRISAIYGRIADLRTKPPEEQEPGAIDQLVVLVDQLRDQRAAAMEGIESQFPDYADLINPKPPGPQAIRDFLTPGEALISFYFTEQRGYVWAIPKVGEMAFAMIDMGRGGLTTVVDRLRHALDPKAQSLGDIPAFEVDLAHGLYRRLLAPVATAWQTSDNLLVVADGALGYLPLGLLVTEPAVLREEAEALFAGYRAVPWLVRRHAITVLPSITALKTLRRSKPDGATEPFIGFGDPVFSLAAASSANPDTKIDTRGVLDLRALPIHLRSVPNTHGYLDADLSVLPRLPDTASEVREIALALSADPTKHVFLGERAREKRVKTMDLSGVRVLAFATHGLVPGDLNGLVEPALALSVPEEAGPEDDGLLTMTEILGLKLDADWVVLSACNTGTGSGAGAEAVSGLGRAFFYAGSRALLVTNWPVETTSARALTTDIFSRQAADPSLGRAEALRRAMVGVMDGPGYRNQEGKEVFTYAHPIFWAPFSIVGDGGGPDA